MKTMHGRNLTQISLTVKLLISSFIPASALNYITEPAVRFSAMFTPYLLTGQGFQNSANLPSLVIQTT